MNLYMQQRIFTWGDKFAIYDSAGNVKYYVEGEVFSFGKKLHLYDLAGRELAYIEQQLFSFLPKYYINMPGFPGAEVIKEFSFFHDEYSVRGLGWTVYGDFFDHEYQITNSGMSIAAVSKEWFTFGDAYQISIASGVNEVMALAVVLVIDACIEAQQRN